jgi:hypothetical protein
MNNLSSCDAKVTSSTTLLLPNGKEISVPANMSYPTDSIVTIRYPANDLSQVQIVSRSPKSWTQSSRDYYHYWIGTGRSSRAECRGCKAVLPKEQPRIITNFISKRYLLDDILIGSRSRATSCRNLILYELQMPESWPCKIF